MYAKRKFIWKDREFVKALMHHFVNLCNKRVKIITLYVSIELTVMEPILIITNFPDKKGALLLAEALIDKHLAACVNVLAACASVYRWQDKIESADEIPVLIKTQRQNYNQVEQIIKKIHPYELPEVIIVPVMGGLPAYLQWITDETNISD